MVRIAVTGGIACGKSLVGSFLADRGVAVCEADELAHELMERGCPVFRKVVTEFGKDILAADGAIDRERLAQRVFSDPRELTALNAIVHPEAKKAWQRWLRNAELARNPKSRKAGQVRNFTPHRRGRNPKSAVAAVIVPLLYEAGEAQGWDTVVCVSASEATQMRRLNNRGLSEPEARKRIAAQMPVADKVALADYVINNDGTKELLRQQTVRVLGNILEKQT